MKFKVGDEVISQNWGKGTVIDKSESVKTSRKYPVAVEFIGGYQVFTKEGKFYADAGEDEPPHNIRHLTKLERALK